jgi:serine/threonine protein kinase
LILYGLFLTKRLPRMPTRETFLEITADRFDTVTCRTCEARIDTSLLALFTDFECPRCGTEHTVPAQFGSFLLLKVVGRGGMGVVYKALDQSLNRNVAIKVMRQEYGKDQQFLKSFLREAQAAAALNHRSVAQIYSFGQEGGQPYIVMELVEGARLDEMIEGGKVLPEKTVLDIGIQVAEGLEAAHEVGLVHSDIKPANILFDLKGVAKVVDFGLASFAKRQEQQPGEVWGTPYYIAPEKVRRKASDHRADIYSLGGTMYHALVGEPPFEGESAKDVVRARLSRPPPEVRSVNPVVSERTNRLVNRMLAEIPARRYPNYLSLLADMRAAYEDASAAVPEVVVAPRPVQSPKPVGSHIWVVLVVVATLVGIISWVLVHASTGSDRTDGSGRFELLNGKLVPASDPQTSVSASAPAEHPVPLEPVRFVDKAIREAIRELTAENLDDARLFLQSLYEGLSEDSSDRYRVRLVQAVTEWVSAESNRLSMTVYLGDLAASNSSAVMEEAILSYAKYLRGEIDGAGLVNQGEAWPIPQQRFASFLIGASAFRGGQFQVALESLTAFLTDFGDLIWTDAFQTLAHHWVENIQAWSDIQRSVVGQDAGVAIPALKTFRASMPSEFHGAIDDRIRLLQDPGADPTAVDSVGNVIPGNDRELQESVRKGIQAMVKEKDFQGAIQRLKSTMIKLESQSAREDMELELERLERIVDIQTFLIDRLHNDPPAGVIQETGGRIADATVGGVRITGVEGSRSLSWSEIPSKLFLKLLVFYLDQDSLSEAIRADLLLSSATYCYLLDARGPAAGFTRKAMEGDGSLEVVAQRLMPELELWVAAQVDSSP